LLVTARLFLANPDDGVGPKRKFLQEPHGFAYKQTTFFIVIAVKTSNLT
jgi:hypothetical protein